MTTPSLVDLLKAKTSEGNQELLARERTSVKELRAEVGGVLRLPEGVTLDRDDINYEAPDDETMILNLGPSHPSTHGVLRVMVEIGASRCCVPNLSSATCTRAWKRPARS